MLDHARIEDFSPTHVYHYRRAISIRPLEMDASTTPEQNMAKMQTLISAVQQDNNLSLIPSLIHEDFVDHSVTGVTQTGHERVRSLLSHLHTALLDVKVEVVHCIVMGDTVTTHKVIRGIDKMDGTRIEKQVMDFVRFEQGLFREHWATVVQTGVRG